MTRRDRAAHSRRARADARAVPRVVVTRRPSSPSRASVGPSFVPFDSRRRFDARPRRDVVVGVELEARRVFVDDDDDDDGEDDGAWMRAWMRARGCVRRRARTIVAGARRARGRDGAWRFAFLSDAARGTGTGTGTGDATRRGGGE